jgi:hypothetical protein
MRSKKGGCIENEKERDRDVLRREFYWEVRATYIHEKIDMTKLTYILGQSEYYKAYIAITVVAEVAKLH